MTKTYEIPDEKMIIADVDEEHHMATVSVYILDDLVRKVNKTGHWIKKEDDTCWWYACSECEQEPLKNRWNDDDVLSTFCPNCGAKMFEPQERSV